MWRTKRVWIVASAVALVTVGAGYRVRQAHAKADFHFETAKVDRGRIVSRVTASGALSAIVTVQVGSQVSGRLQKIMVDFNSPVHKGQLIAKLDARLFEAAYEQARANYVAAQGNLAKSEAQTVEAKRQYQRSQDLASDKLIAQSDLDSAETTAQAAEAQVDASKGAVAQALAALHQAEVNLAYTDIYSPTDGVVISRNVDVGQTVAASLQAPTLFVIAEDLRKMQVDTSVAEADIGRLWAGMPATFTVDAYPGQPFRGTVRQIRNAPQTVQNVVTYDAVVDIDNAELKLKPGMTANVTFIVADRADVLRVPNSALRFRPSADVLALAGLSSHGPRRGRTTGADPTGAAGDSGRGQQAANVSSDRRSVWVLAQGKPQPVMLHTGITDGSWTEVLEGQVSAGDLAITDTSGGSAPEARAGGFPRMF